MGSLTIHAIDPALDARLTERARELAISKNQLMKDLLARSLGLPAEAHLGEDYAEFCGLWDETEHQAFTTRQRENERIDEADWR